MTKRLLLLPPFLVSSILEVSKSVFGQLHFTTSVIQSSQGFVQSPSRKLKFFFKKYLPAFILAFFVLVVVLGVKKGIQSRSATTSNQVIQGAPEQKGKLLATLNREFQFPLKNDKGVEISTFKYVIESAELKNQIVVQGKTATAVPGRIFLVLTLKITNSFEKAIQIKSKDYIRLSVNKNEKEWLAADVHNDPVEVQPISTKYTRIAFIINDTDKNLVLQGGEIDGQKQKIPLPNI